MIYLLLVLAFFATGHFILEAIILPTKRMKYRNQIFQYRDELRRLKFEDHPEINAELFRRLHDGLNFFANNLHQLTLSRRNLMIRQAASVGEAETERRRQLVEDCPVERVREIYGELAKLLDYIFIVNASGWLIYLIPCFYVCHLYKRLKQVLSNLLLTPPKDLKLIFEGQPA